MKVNIEEEKRHYDKIAENLKIDEKYSEILFNYDTPASHWGDRLPRLKKKLLNELNDVKGKKILVYGCGNDNAAIWFSKSGAIVDAIDISSKTVENQILMSKFLKLDINAMVMDAHELQMSSAKYDIVYGNAIIHHLDFSRAIPEVLRVLKSDGTAIFRDVMGENNLLKSYRFITSGFRTSDQHPLTKKDLSYLEKSFSTITSDFYILLGLPVLFLVRLINHTILPKLNVKFRFPELPNIVYKMFDKLDVYCYKYLPKTKRNSWLCLLILKK